MKPKIIILPRVKQPLGTVLLLLLAGALTGCAVFSNNRQDCVKVDLASKPQEDIVQLRYATLPSPLRVIAVHYWFVAFDQEKGEWSRWEGWQDPRVVPTSWGHVHENLMHPDSGVGGGPYRIAGEWRGRKARDIISVLNRPADYPYQNAYRAWPGPNSNTYAAWVLRQARIPLDLNPMAIGKDYCGIVGGGVSPTRTGFHGDTPLAGLELGLKDGLEIHALCLTFGVDVWPPALKTPLGRLGVAPK